MDIGIGLRFCVSAFVLGSDEFFYEFNGFDVLFDWFLLFVYLSINENQWQSGCISFFGMTFHGGSGSNLCSIKPGPTQFVGISIFPIIV